MATKSIPVERLDKKSPALPIGWKEVAQALLRNAGLGIYIVQEGKFQYVNPVFQNLTGYTKDELLGKHSLDLVHAEDREAVRKKAIENLKSNKGSIPYEYRLVKKNGETIWVLEEVTSINYGEKRATVGSFMDITARKELEEAIKYSEKRYRTVLDEIHDAYFEVDLRGTFTFVNDQMSQLLQYSKEELLGMNYKTFTPEEDIKNVYETYNEVYRKGQPILGYDHRVIRKDGTSGFHDVSISPLKNEKGEIIGFRGISRDISERKRLEEAVAYSEKRYRTILDEIHDAYFEVDLNGTFTFVNDQMSQHLQYSKEELLRMSYKNFTPEEELKTVYEAYNRAYRTGEPSLSFGQRTIRKDGTRGFSDVSISPLKNAKGEIIGFRGISRDITARKRLEEEREALLHEIRKINQKLEEANKELQDFVYIASHDLREPLRKISSFGTLLQDSLKGKLNEDQQENFEFMIDGARRMQDMIDALLTYSRLTTKAKPFEWVDLNKVIEDLKKLELATILDETGGTIHVPEPLPSIQADPSQMHQLFQNLIGNGLKFHKEGIPPEIIIRAHEIDIDMIRIEVEDNGIGIDEKYHGQLFTMFKRLQSREQYEGTGIGLASCKKIIERHGGNIGIKSTSGKGSTFWFTLPRERYLKED
ncbi:MAG: PAS domain S-box protein [Dehalococcoidia bacterium]